MVYCYATLARHAGCCRQRSHVDTAHAYHNGRPGTKRSFDVAFIAPYALNHAVVDVAPGLQPFVDVRPRVLTGIATGQTVHLTVTVFLATRRLPGTVTGAVRLFHELHIGMKGGGIRMLRWPVPFANPLLLTVGAGRTEGL